MHINIGIVHDKEIGGHNPKNRKSKTKNRLTLPSSEVVAMGTQAVRLSRDFLFLVFDLTLVFGAGQHPSPPQKREALPQRTHNTKQKQRAKIERNPRTEERRHGTRDKKKGKLKRKNDQPSVLP